MATPWKIRRETLLDVLASDRLAVAARVRKGRVQVKRPSSTGWTWFDFGSLESLARKFGHVEG